MSRPGLWAEIAVVVAAAYALACLPRRFDRAARQSAPEPADLELSEVEILDRLETELDHRAIRAIDDAYGHRRWTQ